MSSWTEMRIPVPWGFIAAKTCGNSADQPMICVHGAVDNAASFDYLLPLLPQKFYFVCIDLPGHGISSHYGSGIPYKFTDYAFILKRVVDYCGWFKVNILGHHIGGLIGMYFASCYSDIVGKLIVIDPVVGVHNEHFSQQLTKLSNDIFDSECLKNEKGNYESLRRRVQTWRSFPMSAQTEKLLMERNIRKCQDQFILSLDPRIAFVYHRPNEKTHLAAFLKPMKCELLILMCKGVVRHKTAFPVKTLINTFRKNCFRVEYYLLDDFNDIHINNPEKTSAVINKFLECPKSAL